METKFRILKIAKKILSDVILRDEQEFKEYLENHPDYREDTVFIVDGVKRQAPHKNKKTESFADELSKLIRFQTPQVIKTPYDEGNEITANDVYFLQYGDKKTVFKPSTTIDQDIRDTLTLDVVPSSKREVMAFEISEKLGLNVIPPTFLTKRTVPSLSDDWSSFDIEDKEKEGSEQMFVEGETWLQYCLRSGEKKVRETLRDEKIQKGLSMIAVTDYLIGNSDRHMSNFMINDKKEIAGIDNGLSFAPNGEKNNMREGEFRSLPLDILYRMYKDYDFDYSVEQMRFEDYNTSEFSDDYEMLTKLEILNDAQGIHPDVCNFFKSMDYDGAEKIISNIMEHYGMDDKSAKSTLDRLKDLQRLFNE